MILLEDNIPFSYYQIIVFDECIALPGLAWTDLHIRQGFARQSKVVSFGTLTDFGIGALVVTKERREFCQRAFERIISVPFEISSGVVRIEAPDEHPVTRKIELPMGNYCVTFGQRVVEGDFMYFVLDFSTVSEPLSKSNIILADKALNPPEKLLESCESIGSS